MVYYWPPGVSREETIEAFIEAFKTLSYEVCDSPEYEDGYEKIAIYASEEGKPTHAARQLNADAWSSKLGGFFDIEHELDAVCGGVYGEVAVIMKRRCSQTM